MTGAGKYLTLVLLIAGTPARGAESVIDEREYLNLVPSALSSTSSSEIEIVSPEDIVSESRPASGASGDPQRVKVKQGDTLYSIAKAHNVKVYELAEHNKLSAPFILKPGQTLDIPSAGMAAETTRSVITNLDSDKTFIEKPKVDSVIVKKGNTIYSIAKDAGVPLKDLILRNGLSPPYTISVGRRIYIPSTAFHIVQKQDTMYSISRKYGVNLNSLAKLNGISEPYVISAGQKLTLPASNIEAPERPKAIVETASSRPKIVEVRKPAPKDTAEEEIIVKKQESRAAAEKVVARPAPMSSNKFLWPVSGKVISEYGVKPGGKRNDGINISAPLGTEVSAAENGIVAYSGNELKGLGNLVIIRHDNNYMTIYAHNDAIMVSKGDKVGRGDAIASVGRTGRVSTPQLHFEIRQSAKSINPVSMLERR